jgi:hypothetical protein
MSGKLISILLALGLLGSVAIALAVPPSDFAIFVVRSAYPTKQDFDWAFAKVETASTFDLEQRAADGEKIRLVGLKRMNRVQFSE